MREIRAAHTQHVELRFICTHCVRLKSPAPSDLGTFKGHTHTRSHLCVSDVYAPEPHGTQHRCRYVKSPICSRPDASDASAVWWENGQAVGGGGGRRSERARAVLSDGSDVIVFVLIKLNENQFSVLMTRQPLSARASVQNVRAGWVMVCEHCANINARAGNMIDTLAPNYADSMMRHATLSSSHVGFYLYVHMLRP